MLIRKFSVFILFLLLCFDGYAQRLDLHSMGKVHRYEIEKRSAHGRKFVQKLFNENATPALSKQRAFVTLVDGCTRSDLENEGLTVLMCRGNIAIVEVDIEDAYRVSLLDCVKAMKLERELNMSIDKAREAQNIDAIHFNAPYAGLPRAYTGKYVVSGIVDQGVDPHHINFRFNNNETRVSFLSHLYIGADGSLAEDYYNYTNLDDFTTDNPGAYHGTHTLGIMSGGYTGPVTVAKPWRDPGSPEVTEYITEDNRYYGVAPEADIVVSCGEMADVFIALGMEQILGYSDYIGLPAVINLSLGSNSGAHDPNSQMSQVFDIFGEEAIICIAAGNEGDLKIALNKRFTSEDNKIKSFVYPYAYQYDESDPDSFTVRSGSVEFWSEDDTPFEIKAVIYNKKRNYRAAYNMPIAGDNIGTYYVSSSDYQMTEEDVIGDPTFMKAFEGFVGVGAKIDEQTGRYYGMVDYYVYNNPETNLNDDYVLGFEIVGKAGKRVDCYCDGTTTWIDDLDVDGFDDGSPNGSISDMAVAHNLIVVGSYNTRNEWPVLSGSTQWYSGESFRVGAISGFSSFGTLADGRNLPTVCAPGSALISSISWPAAKLSTDEILTNSCTAKVVEDGRVNYWKQEIGTSMATPFVSGSIALWLEANPNLTIDDVKQIIATTSVVDDDVKAADPVRWGAGKFNALGGLKEAIRMAEASVEGITVDNHNDRLMVTAVGENVYNVFLGETRQLDVTVYGIDGSVQFHESADMDELSLDLNHLASGVYILTANGRHSTKIVVK